MRDRGAVQFSSFRPHNIPLWFRRSLPGCAKIVSFPDVPSNLFQNCSDDDPAFVFYWHDTAVAALLAALLALGPAQRPAWLAPVLPNPTTDDFKHAIMTHVCNTSAGAMPHHGSACIAPLTLHEWGLVRDRITGMCYDPAMVAVHMVSAMVAPAAPLGPMAHVLYIRENTTPLRALNAAVQVTAPGVQVFA